jgi:hypothetical protein
MVFSRSRKRAVRSAKAREYKQRTTGGSGSILEFAWQLRAGTKLFTDVTHIPMS